MVRSGREEVFACGNPAGLHPQTEAVDRREDGRRGHSVAFLLLQGSLYAVSPTSIYRCQTSKEGSTSSVFMLLMLMNVRPICHRMGVCNFSLQYHNENRETNSGKGSERKREKERERTKESVEKSLNFIILLGADLMRTTPLPLQNPHPRQWHPPKPTRNHWSWCSAQISSPQFCCYLHIPKVPRLLGRNPSTATSNFHLGLGRAGQAGCSTISACFLDTQISQSTRFHSR